MSQSVLQDDDYIIGTNDAEIARLGFQHAIWQEETLRAFRHADIRPGMTVMDVGAGPGYAAFDLAQRVGPEGRVIALDQSAHFLKALETGAKIRGLSNIDIVETDLADYDWPAAMCDVVWSRWCLSFVPDVEAALAGIDRSLKPGGSFVSLEYVDYRSVAMQPTAPAFQSFIEAVQKSWVHFGGDPNVARRFPKAFADLNWSIESKRTIVHAAQPGEPFWEWPISWFEQAPDRMVELGFLSPDEAAEFYRFIAERKADPNSMLMTPMVLESVARKPR